MKSPSLMVTARTPRLGFIGLGWIGRDRLLRLVEADAAEVAGLCDIDRDAMAGLAERFPGARCADDLDALLSLDLDGLVVATPNACHAEETIAALERGLPVFCQKPLGRNLDEVRRMVEAAAAADRRLDVDLTYRSSRCIETMWERIRTGDIGRLYRMEFVFHNGYGPDKPWFYDLARSGGGCMLDLGVHLIDLAIHAPGPREVQDVRALRWSRGEALAFDGLTPKTSPIEDDAIVELTFDDGARARVACSWRAPMGCDAVVEATYVGTKGALRLRNLDGSFWRLAAERLEGTRRTALMESDDQWRGRAVIHWARTIAASPAFDADAWTHLRTARILDAAMGRVRFEPQVAGLAREVAA